MNIIEAVEILKAGGKVRRRIWPHASFLMVENSVIINFYGKKEKFPYTWRPVTGDLVSTDWVEYTKDHALIAYLDSSIRFEVENAKNNYFIPKPESEVG